MKETTKSTYHKLFQNLIWPAVAGNVLWAFFTLLIEQRKNILIADVYTRLMILLMLVIYLVVDWLTSEKEMERLKNHYWIGDILHSISIIFFSISIYLNDDEAMYESAKIVLLVPFFCHLFGMWEPKDIKKNKTVKRIAISVITGGGFFIFLYLHNQQSVIWSYPISIFIVLVFWFIFRDRIYPPK